MSNILLENRENKLIGHEKEYNYLYNSFKKGNPSHAYVISGYKGIGKATFIYNVIRNLLSENINDDFVVNSIKRQIINNSSPDMMIIESKDNQITIDDIRKIKKFDNLSGIGSVYKIIIIDSVDDLNINSSNALLKILEEPSENCFIFLINHNESNIPKTIRSRSRIIRLKNLNRNDSVKILKNISNIDDELIDKLLYISENSPGVANILYDADIFEIYLNWFWSISDIANIIKLYRLIDKEKINQNLILNVMIDHFYNKIFKSIKKIDFIEIINNEKKYIDKISDKKNIDNWFGVYDKHKNLINSIDRNNLDYKQVLFLLINEITDK